MAAREVRGDAGLLERDGELGLIGALVARVGAGEGGLVCIEGQPGVGKTELLRAAAELGEAQGLRVLRARGSELDRGFAFGVVRQLLEREVAAEPALLVGGAEPAAAVFAAAGGTSGLTRASSRPCRGCTGWSRTSPRRSRCCCSPMTFTGRTRHRCAGWCFLPSVWRTSGRCWSWRRGRRSQAPTRSCSTRS